MQFCWPPAAEDGCAESGEIATDALIRIHIIIESDSFLVSMVLHSSWGLLSTHS